MADAIVVNSGWSYEALRSEGVPAERLHVVPIPYEAPERSASRRRYPERFTPARPLRLLFLGQVNLRKGVAELLGAMARLADQPVELHLVGPAGPPVPDRFANLHNVFWRGAVPRQDVGALFDAADLFVLPTHSDGFGLTQVEALAAGLPVLTSSSCARIVDDGRSGQVLEVVDEASIAAAVREVLREPSILAGWARSCALPEASRMDGVGRLLSALVDNLAAGGPSE
nr:glycosyltransferase family 4 protein [Luteolibacter marinus]